MGTVELTCAGRLVAVDEREGMGWADRVGNDEDVGVGRGVGGCFGEVADDGGVGVKEV